MLASRACCLVFQTPPNRSKGSGVPQRSVGRASAEQANILDAPDNLAEIRKDSFIGEVKNVNRERAQPRVTFDAPVFASFARVRAPVHLNCQPHFRTVEVNDQPSDPVLSSKLERDSSQRGPEPFLGIRGACAKAFLTTARHETRLKAHLPRVPRRLRRLPRPARRRRARST